MKLRSNISLWDHIFLFGVWKNNEKQTKVNNRFKCSQCTVIEFIFVFVYLTHYYFAKWQYLAD